jgi:adenylylsulfate kinase-like enzyme
MDRKVPPLLITGTLGAGKTTVAAEISELLDQAQIPHAHVDVDARRLGIFPEKH